MILVFTPHALERGFFYASLLFIFPPAFCFLQLAAEYSGCPSGKKSGDHGWFPRGKMAGLFQDVSFNTPVGATCAPLKSIYSSIQLIYTKAVQYYSFHIISSMGTT
ncbi:hypothetical protein NE237_005732 [Protea cynaroides]|uniref:Peptidyl-prolyl cis-trans isomerase n=1 Tax=Protea cynaroides TaxID=273540 RepID=A0A9Q0KKX4_9MAGN|nr:hypothetical protein NE237_005732 [Protea cynaroides]